MRTLTRTVAAAIALLTLLPLASAQASDQSPPPPLPELQPLKPFEAKWIVGPGQAAGGTYMGWETVAYDDPTYPPPRHP